MFCICAQTSGDTTTPVCFGEMEADIVGKSKKYVTLTSVMNCDAVVKPN
jgi:hypothetical protein